VIARDDDCDVLVLCRTCNAKDAAMKRWIGIALDQSIDRILCVVREIERTIAVWGQDSACLLESENERSAAVVGKRQ
jgi:hypothetical protein